MGEPTRAPFTPRDMALLRLAAQNDGPLLLATREHKATATRLRKMVPPPVVVRTTRARGGDRKHYLELTDAGRKAVRRSLAHA